MRKKTYLCMACLAAVLSCTVQCTDEDFMTPPRQAEVEGFTLVAEAGDGKTTLELTEQPAPDGQPRLTPLP